MIWLNGGILFPDKDRGQTSASLCVTLLPDRFPSCVTDIQTYIYFLCHTITDIQFPMSLMAPDTSTDIQTYMYYTSCHTTTDIQFPMCIMAPDIFLPVSQTSRHTDLLPMSHYYGCPVPHVTWLNIYFFLCHRHPDILYKKCIYFLCHTTTRYTDVRFAMCHIAPDRFPSYVTDI